MTRKTLKITLVSIAALLMTLTAGVVLASTKTQTGELPTYVGSQACLGCHVDKFVNWDSSHHSYSLKQVMTEADLPLPISEAPAELQAELSRAVWNFRDHRFMTTDLKTGKLIYLGIEFNGGKYQAYSGKGNAWDDTCGGCHSGPISPETSLRSEPGIGCESCHGPGSQHIAGKGDVSKIFNNVDPSKSCAGCHSGYNQTPGAKRFPVGYRPGMELKDVGFLAGPVDPDKAPQAMHHKGAVPQWEASAHASAAILLNDENAQDRCYACHSSEFQLAQKDGKPFSVKDHPVNDGVTCVTCHDPHNSSEPGQLRMPEKELCVSCHTGGATPEKGFTAGKEVHHSQAEVLGGYAAVGIAATKGPHSELTCVECHMTGNNHLMKVVKPADVIGTTQQDTCTTCHKDSSSESRAAYLNMWQQTVSDKMTDLKHDIDVVDAALKASPTGLSADLKAKYDAARTNWTMVGSDRSGGAHNFEYVIKILTTAKKDTAAARQAFGK
jgi:predicted CXXCH cytochrome family protein